MLVAREGRVGMELRACPVSPKASVTPQSRANTQAVQGYRAPPALKETEK